MADYSKSVLKSDVEPIKKLAVLLATTLKKLILTKRFDLESFTRGLVAILGDRSREIFSLLIRKRKFPRKDIARAQKYLLTKDSSPQGLPPELFEIVREQYIPDQRIVQLARNGFFDKAREEAKRIKLPTKKALTLVAIGDILAELKQLEEADNSYKDAIDAILEEKKEFDRNQILRAIAVHQVKHGLFKSAVEAMKNIERLEFKIDVMIIMFEKHLKDGSDLAKPLLSKIKKILALHSLGNPLLVFRKISLAILLAKYNMIEEALDVVDTIGSFLNVEVLCDIMKILVQRNQKTKAITICKRYIPKFHREEYGVEYLLNCLIDIGFHKEAIEILKTIKNKKLLRNVSGEIAVELAKRGKIQEALNLSKNLDYPRKLQIYIIVACVSRDDKYIMQLSDLLSKGKLKASQLIVIIARATWFLKEEQEIIADVIYETLRNL